MAKRKLATTQIDPNICFECGAPAVKEHYVVPRSLGGTKRVPLCWNCYNKVHSIGGERIDRVSDMPVATFVATKVRTDNTSIGYSCSRLAAGVTASGARAIKGHPVNILFSLYTAQFEMREGSLRRCGEAKFQKLADELNALGYTTLNGEPYTARHCRYLYAQMSVSGYIE
ncbi:MAG: HNH endonuclease [Rikenellaceae bacterium]|nr:HNH endonuclease [Rikenellaceae bacterium]